MQSVMLDVGRKSSRRGTISDGSIERPAVLEQFFFAGGYFPVASSELQPHTRSMSTVCYSHKTSKRPPGRPAGSAPYKAEDEVLLRKAACALAENNALTLTAVLRACDVTAEKDLARLRARWRQVGPAFLDDARRNPAAPPVRDSLLLLSSLVAGFADRAANSGDFQNLQEALARCREELRGEAGGSLADVTTIFWTMQESGDHRPGSALRELSSLIGDRTTAHGMSDGDLLFLWARLCDREAIAAWAREERLNDDHAPAH